jgi:hypothetical protein
MKQQYIFLFNSIMLFATSVLQSFRHFKLLSASGDTNIYDKPFDLIYSLSKVQRQIRSILRLRDFYLTPEQNSICSEI